MAIDELTGDDELFDDGVEKTEEEIERDRLYKGATLHEQDLHGEDVSMFDTDDFDIPDVDR